MEKNDQLHADALVIGSGVSGLICALELSKKFSVILVTKKELMESNTNYAQGGIAAVMSVKDSFKSHIEDTLRTGEGISRREPVEVMVREAPSVIKKLIRMGAGFNHLNGKLSLGREGGHSKNRIVHAKDATGKEIEQALIVNIRSRKNVTLLENTIALDIIKQKDQCVGARVLCHDNNTIKTILSRNTILATGGAGQVYLRTTNPKVATGDGIAMALKAGADIENMEFVQFHPTTLMKRGCPHYLISEAVRGEGARLLNSKGERFMKKYHPMAELAPRDIVSRSILAEQKCEEVYLDLTHKSKAFLRNRFPNIYYTLWWYGVMIDKDLIPVTPSAHYFCGGVRTDTWGCTSIPNLYAVGEVACTGVHGANRLASNSLLESVVFAQRAAAHIYRFRKNNKPSKINLTKLNLEGENQMAGNIADMIRMDMWANAGIIRTQKSLRSAKKSIGRELNKIKEILDKKVSAKAIETQNMGLVAMAIVLSAMKRPESRGTHFNSEFPYKEEKFEGKSTLISAKDMKEYL